LAPINKTKNIIFDALEEIAIDRNIGDIKEQIHSLDQRANSIHQAKKGLLKFLEIN
jgi:hypothetical protein